ncbi:hypothetical protein [Mucilaginibacter sp. UYCu711]|uniref:hypothetical protein n=1 Tax=Mucilaginibacter sp. UYCu711 TaxID=3156339 RepID=UPI003D212259
MENNYNFDNCGHVLILDAIDRSFREIFDASLVLDKSGRSPFKYNSESVVSNRPDNDFGEILLDVLMEVYDKLGEEFMFVIDELVNDLKKVTGDLVLNYYVINLNSPFLFFGRKVVPEKREYADFENFIENTKKEMLIRISG